MTATAVEPEVDWEQHERDFWVAQGDLAVVAEAELVAFWATLDHSDADEVVRALDAFLPSLVQEYGEIGAVLAADFYEEVRETSPAIRRAYRARMGEAIPLAQIKASTGWAVGPLYGKGKNPVPEQALKNLVGVTTRLVLAGGRNTIRDNVREDPDAIGWKRIGDGHSCNFCRMLIGRGEVYSADTARFGAHDSCGCQAVPAFDDGSDGKPVSVEQYLATKRNVTDADRARVRDYLANMDSPASLIATAIAA